MKRILLLFVLLCPVQSVSAMDYVLSLLGYRLNEQLFKAISQDGSVDEISQLIEKGADVNAKSKYGDNPLRLAARNGLSDVCMKLIEQGADVNAQNKNGWTPLTYAVINGHVDSFKGIIEQTLIGGNVEVSKAKLYTLLCCFREKKICKDIRLHLLSFNQEVLPFLIYLAIRGCALPPQLKNAIAIELNNRRKFLKPLIVKAQKHAKTDEIKSILSRHIDLLKF